MLQIGCAAIGGTILGKTTSQAKTRAPGSTPWTWKPIEPESIQERAYQSAWAKIGCMYGVVESVIGTLADRYGAPYNSFPIEATVYGSGGIGGVGSVCGTVNAAGLLFGLFVEKQEDMFALCNEVSLWYEKNGTAHVQASKAEPGHSDCYFNIGIKPLPCFLHKMVQGLGSPTDDNGSFRALQPDSVRRSHEDCVPVEPAHKQGTDIQ